MDSESEDWPLFGLRDDVRAALAALAPETSAVLVTLIAARGGSPRELGAQMLVTAAEVVGYVSGGCVEADVARHARALLGGGGASTPDGKSKLAPPLKGSERVEAQADLVATIVLNGLTGVNNGKTYPEQMPNFRWADDERLATVLTYVRNEWGNSASAVTPEDIARHRSAAVADASSWL